MKITSVNNELIKETAKLLQRKYRDEKGLFLLEGEKCIQEALASGLEIIHIFEIEGCKNFFSVENGNHGNLLFKKRQRHYPNHNRNPNTLLDVKCYADGKGIEKKIFLIFKKKQA